MRIEYMAFANMTDGKKVWRVNISHHNTKEEAESALKSFRTHYPNDSIHYSGIHKFYIFTKAEWRKEQYTSRSLTNPKIRTWMTNEGQGCTLLFEHDHFEIL